ncbi:methylthioribose-1-phosphate isomerase [Acidiphilium sp. MT5]
MKIDGRAFRSIWLDETDHWSVRIIDQTQLPWNFDIARLSTVDHVAHAIRAMQVRGAPLIGATAAYGVALAMRADPSNDNLTQAITQLAATRPTAINLRWALERMELTLRQRPPAERVDIAYQAAAAICDEDVATNRAIGAHGLGLIQARAHGNRRVNLLTHCNAGWLATVDWGTALAPIYCAHDAGIDVHVYVDETRPRNQGASLTAWELGKHGVPHTVIVDNAGGHLMQRGAIDMVIVGTDRVTRTGDVANKIGTYLKALAARDNGIPFYVALPASTIDWRIADGLSDIPIEERAASEVTTITGRALDGSIATVRLVPKDSDAVNPAFDVTPARLVSGLITECGICTASEAGLAALFPQAREPVAA